MSSLGARRLTFLLPCLAWMVGCGGNGGTSSPPPTISEFHAVSFDNSKDTLGIGDTIRLSGKATDSKELKRLTLSILDSAGRPVDTISSFNLTTASYSFDQQNSNLQVVNDGAWGADGAYTIRLTMTNSGGEQSHVDLKVYAKGSGGGGDTQLADKGIVNLGAQGVGGSFLDVSHHIVQTPGPATDSLIDIVFGLNAQGTLVLMSPLQALSDGFDLSTWNTLNATTIAYSSGPLTSIAAVQSCIGSKVDQWQPVQVGWYGIHLVSGEYAAIRVISLSAARDRTATTSVEIFE
jgi:hypothetical protein